MIYQTFPPPENLKTFIRYFWALNNKVDHGPEVLSAFPDGCPGVIMVQSDNGAICDHHHKKLPEIYLHGQITKPSALSYSGNISAFGICFQPHALKCIFGIDANELTNTGLDFNLIKNKKHLDLTAQLTDEQTVEGRIKILANYLLYQQQGNDKPTDETVKHAIALILQSKGTVSLKELQQRLKFSERSLERKFNQSIGISPKLFSRICRFQESLSQLRTSNFDKLSDIAYENKYSDQAHFIRAFKEFTGFSPLEFKKQRQ
jgi:AraC-like DNA-binding protein